MAKKISFVAIISIIFVTFGCTSPNTQGSNGALPIRTSGVYYPGSAISANAGEMDIVVKVETSRI